MRGKGNSRQERTPKETELTTSTPLFLANAKSKDKVFLFCNKSQRSFYISTKKIYSGIEFNLRKIVLTFKSPWKLTRSHDGQGDVNLNISSTFVKHLQPLFTQKNQDNSEKGHLVISHTFDLDFVLFQGHKNHFCTGYFSREIFRSFQIRRHK